MCILLVASEDHSDRDCLLIALMSHGDDGILYARDQQYKPERLWSYFTSDKCPTLAGKPKLFFIQVGLFPYPPPPNTRNYLNIFLSGMSRR